MRSPFFVPLGVMVALAVGCDGPAIGADAAWLDGSVPALDGETPRPDGRVDLDGGVGPDDAGADGGVADPIVPDADPTFGAGGMALVNASEASPSAVWSVVVQPD